MSIEPKIRLRGDYEMLDYKTKKIRYKTPLLPKGKDSSKFNLYLKEVSSPQLSFKNLKRIISLYKRTCKKGQASF